MAKRILRPKEVMARLSIGRNKLNEDFIRTGRLRWVQLGPRCVGAIEEEVDALIDQMIDERDQGRQGKRSPWPKNTPLRKRATAA